MSLLDHDGVFPGLHIVSMSIVAFVFEFIKISQVMPTNCTGNTMCIIACIFSFRTFFSVRGGHLIVGKSTESKN